MLSGFPDPEYFLVDPDPQIHTTDYELGSGPYSSFSGSQDAKKIFSFNFLAPFCSLLN
jgi:hypothetical protein